MDWSISGIGAALLTSPRWARAPIALYRHGLGWLFGSRLMMLEHVGRKSGEPRYVCLEVVERPDPQHVFLASARGVRSQWYQNLRARPACHVTIGRVRRRPAHARLLDDAESAAVLQRYGANHPKAWRRLRTIMEKGGTPDPDRLPMVELRLT